MTSQATSQPIISEIKVYPNHIHCKFEGSETTKTFTTPTPAKESENSKRDISIVYNWGRGPVVTHYTCGDLSEEKLEDLEGTAPHLTGDSMTLIQDHRTYSFSESLPMSLDAPKLDERWAKDYRGIIGISVASSEPTGTDVDLG
uniref:Uncharacterized protein n=1 Tax=Kwoniella bestiolae CBS 10118 TaxID=1296100 RepID=A0A1B9GDZ0_9TREE|nr:hypothetical protein I302_00720 [Kwoniella bestiolae CBS 10118]OCF29224.1 hypothetical protein I302_00720 [Kwoniella bestiolae CBS 10118]